MINVFDTLYLDNTITSLKYKLCFKGEKLILQCTSKIELEDPNSAGSLKLGVRFGSKLDEYNEENFPTSFMLEDVYDNASQVAYYEIDVPLDISLNDLWLTNRLTIAANPGTFFHSFQDNYEVFEEAIFNENGLLLVTNFIEDRLACGHDFNVNEPKTDELEKSQEQYMEVLASRYQRQYSTPLFYSFCGPTGRDLRLMYGLNLDDFILDNSYIPELAEDPDFMTYMRESDFVNGVEITLYDDNFSYDVPYTKAADTFGMNFSNIVNGSLGTANIEFTSKLLKCTTLVTYEEPIQQYLNVTLVPAFQEELETLQEVYLSQITPPTDLDIYSFEYDQIKNTLLYASLILFEQNNNMQLLLNPDNSIYCDQNLLSKLIEMNDLLQTHFKKLISTNAKLSSIDPLLQIEFDEMVEVPPLSLYTDVIKTQKVDFGLPTIAKGDFQTAAQNNILNYFSSTTTNIAGQTYDLEPMSYRYFPAFKFCIKDKKFDNKFRFSSDEMTSKDVYNYYNALLKIIQINAEQKVKYPIAPKLDAITEGQYMAQEGTRQLSNMLNSVSILARAIDPTKAEAEANLYATTLDKGLEKLPASQKTGLRLASNTKSGGASSADNKSFNANNLFPTSLLAPLVMKTVKSFEETSFYNYKSVFSQKESLSQVEEMAIPLVFSMQSYINTGLMKNFNNPEPALNNLINFALLYFTIKYLFRIQYLDVEDGSFKDLDNKSFVENVETKNRDLICRISPYKNGDFGVSQPKLLSLPIYSRHFVITK